LEPRKWIPKIYACGTLCSSTHFPLADFPAVAAEQLPSVEREQVD
jgi:hypothetical protein